MSRLSIIERNEKRKKMSSSAREKRAKISQMIKNKTLSMEERFNLCIKLSKMPRDTSKVRIRNRCALTGRPRAFYRFFGMSRSCIRHYAGNGQISGVIKSSW